MESEILQLLQGSPGTRFSYKEVGRMVDRRQFRDDLRWAYPFLERLATERAIVKDETLYFFPESKTRDTEITVCVRTGAVGPVATHELSGDTTTTLKPLDLPERSPKARPDRDPAAPEKKPDPNRDRA